MRAVFEAWIKRTGYQVFTESEGEALYDLIEEMILARERENDADSDAD